jgi:SAM-dependent methyltransferase
MTASNPRSEARLRVDDAEYAEMLEKEAQFWATQVITTELLDTISPPLCHELMNEQMTGRRHVTWLDDLASRGPFTSAALLGSHNGYFESKWLQKRASVSLDIYELSSGVIEKSRARLDSNGLLSGVQYFQTDLNRVELPAERYDLVWAVATLHHLVELEHIFDQVHRALKPNGLFAFYEYIGEKRVQLSPRRLKACQEALAIVPKQYWRNGDHVRGANIDIISPFEALRSDEIYPAVRDRFQQDYWAEGGGLSLVLLLSEVDINAIVQCEPALMERLSAEERRMAADPDLGGVLGYGVFRRVSG